MSTLVTEWAPTPVARGVVMEAGYAPEDSQKLILSACASGTVGVQLTKNGGYWFPLASDLAFLAIDFDASRASLTPPAIPLEFDYLFPFVTAAQDDGQNQSLATDVIGPVLPYPIEISLIDLHRHLLEVRSIQGPAQRVNKGGRPPKYDWPRVDLEIARWAIWKGWPSVLKELTDHLATQIQAHDGEPPEERQLARRVRKVQTILEKPL